MNRPLSLLFTLGLFAFAACTRERVIVVHDGPQAASSTSATAIATDLPASSATSTSAIAAPEKTTGDDSEWGIRERDDSVEYARVVGKVATMTNDRDLQARVTRRGLSLVNVMWEDTGRAENSALGPNISDFTLQVRRKDREGQFHAALMPVIRPPNFTDKTGDVAADKFFVRMGNEKGAGELSTVALTDVLRNIKKFASVPDSILGDGNLLAPRDSHFLVSAQAVFLPIPKTGKAEFNPVLFNYQSAPRSPAVLTILVTRQGASMQVIENDGDDDSAVGAGQELYFNNKGQRASFTAERKSDVEQRIAAQGGPKTEDDESAIAKGADVLFMVQVPLVHKNIGRLGGADEDTDGLGDAMSNASGPGPLAAAAPAAKAMRGRSAERSDVEQAVLGHGANLGPFNEGHRIKLVRDKKFPIRVTIQFYKATSNGIVSDIDLDSITKSIGSVYEHADFVGSLVIPEGDSHRPTAWQTMPREWFPW